ncbi:TerC/Alx family metal homeostasis membrane protein [Humibacter albus]|jgi:tellurite resistance protein TerC|uniref:TerC/Alx family metal homeostasis membrane protein n=1 Tax=Humibacter albus TaxID=427754 RepID=UPI0003B6FD37|nr:TerC/Alx family metal homeostasis membrane protein [Humibacter albus]
MLTALPLWFEITSLVILCLLLVGDLVLAVKRPHVPKPLEAAVWVGFYSLLAVVFALVLFWMGDAEHAGQFLAGWLTEYSLSIDNLFVFIVIMTRFAVPVRYQQEALFAGIIIALILRAIFIVIGAQLIENFSWIFYLFGAFLLYTAYTQAFGKQEEEGQKDNALTRFARKHLKISDRFDKGKLRVTINGKRFFTPMILVIVALGTTDLLFALDSIPAIFGITTSPFLVFAANVFALMGLRQLYFLLGHLLERLEYLKYGIAAILVFIGVKLVLHALHTNEVPFINGGRSVHWAPEIGTWASLGFIAAAMVVATMASLTKMWVDRRAGRLPDEQERRQEYSVGESDAGGERPH